MLTLGVKTVYLGRYVRIHEAGRVGKKQEGQRPKIW